MMKRLLSLALLLLPLALWAAKSDVVTVNSAATSVSFSSGNSYEWDWDSSNHRLRSTNYHINSSTSQTTIYIHCYSCNFSFDYAVSSESNRDKLTIILDGQTIVNAVSGSVSNTYNGTLSSGSHSLVLEYVKDVSTHSSDDRAYLSNVKFMGTSGSFGNNLTWRLDGTILYIWGSGAMPDYTSASQAPWYQYLSSIRRVDIEATINHIGDYAFAGCTNLYSVVSHLNSAGDYYKNEWAEWRREYAYNPLSIGAHSFDGCTQLREVYSSTMGHSWYWLNDEWVDWDDDDDPCPMEIIATRITAIGDDAFYGCSSLPSIKVNPGTTIGVGSFERCSTLARVDGAINVVGNAAFSYCSNLTSISLNLGISRIGDNAFYSCRSLNSITIPSSVTEIGQSAFYGCNNLTSVNIPSNVSTISQYTFYNCAKAVINMPNTVTRVESNAFYNCKKLASVSTNLTYIGGNAFEGCTMLNSVEISSDIEYIGPRAFYGCSNLSTVTFPQTVNNLYGFGNNVFTSTPYMSNIVPESGVKYVGPIALEYDGTVTNLSLKDGTIFIMGNLFSQNGSNLQSITIPGTVREIPQQGFFSCTNLSEVTFEYSATPIIVNNNKYSDGIGGGIFEMCPLTNITINRDIELTYKYQAHSYDGYQCGLFYNRSRVPYIQEIVIGENVTTLPDYLLYAQYNGSTNLQSITCQGDIPPTCTNNAFYGVPTTTNIYVPCGSLDTYQNATGWSIFSNIEMDICEYTRTTASGNYGTICLPKAVAHEDLEDCGAVFFKIVYAVTNTNLDITGILMEEETEGLEAGKPYIFRATADELVLPYTGEAVADPVAANGLVGNLSETPLNVPQDMYVLSNNQIRKLAGGTATAGQNRAYIDLTNVTKLNYVPAAAPNRVVLNVEGSNPMATDIMNIKSEDIQKVIRDGQVLILRDGKTYNVLGNTL